MSRDPYGYDGGDPDDGPDADDVAQFRCRECLALAPLSFDYCPRCGWSPDPEPDEDAAQEAATERILETPRE